MKGFAPYAWLVALGAGWGVTQPLTKIAVSGGHGVMGLIFWQLAISVLVLGAVQLARRRSISFAHPLIWFYLVITLTGTLIPNSFSYVAIAVLPSGLMSIFISLVPMFSFPIALALGTDRFSFKRLFGLSLGLTAVLLIVWVPDALPSAAMLIFVPLALVAPLMYAFEGNFVAKWGTGGAGPLQLLLGASVIGCFLALPLALATGQFVSLWVPWGPPEWALVASSVIHAIVYTLFVTLIRRYGAVFSQQVGYLVTVFGVGWAMLILGESYSGPIWVALALMFAGIYLVSPRPVEDDGKPASPN